MGGRAADVYAAHLRLGRRLPTPVAAFLTSLRILLVGWLTMSDSGGIPAYVVVTRRSDGEVVGRLSAGRKWGVGEALLQTVQSSMAERSAAEFLRQWHLDE